MRKLSKYIANADLSTIYKMVLKLGSPEFLLRRGDSLWSRYYNAGRLQAREVRPKYWKLELDLPPGDDNAAPDYFTCGPGVCAWLQHGLALTGVHATVRHSQPRSTRYEYDVTW